MDDDLDWNLPLHCGKGAPSNMLGIELFFDFDWIEVMGHPQMQFPNGLWLARRVLRECPDDKKPALLLTNQEGQERRSFETEHFYVVVVNLPHYLEEASADPSAVYFGDSFGAGLTRISQLDRIANLTPPELAALLDAKLTSEGVARWASASPERLDALREIVAVKDKVEQPASPASIAAALRAMDSLGEDEIEEFRAEFSAPDRESAAKFLSDHDILSMDLVQMMEFNRRCRAVEELKVMLAEDQTEGPWQDWFENNDWVLGTEFIRVLGERPIDVKNVADFLMQAYDGFLDVVEIKRPEGKLKFWADGLDHGNYVPHSDLIKAVTQASSYLLEVEREADSVKFFERLGAIKAIKPRCVLIYGRSHKWNTPQREAYRVLNAGYHSLSIMTYDHVLERAQRILGM
ncbi:MAG: Shedu immune nuclease family protein [Solirubrobacterales bacterium]